MAEKTKSTVSDDMKEATDMIMNAMVFVIVMAVMLPKMMPQFSQAQSYFERQSFEGQSETRILNATSTVQNVVLANPWVGVYFINDGPDIAMIRLNDESGDIIYIRPLETITINRLGAQDRIYAIWYWCENNQTALLRVYGQY